MINIENYFFALYRPPPLPQPTKYLATRLLPNFFNNRKFLATYRKSEYNNLLKSVFTKRKSGINLDIIKLFAHIYMLCYSLANDWTKLADFFEETHWYPGRNID